MPPSNMTRQALECSRLTCWGRRWIASPNSLVTGGHLSSLIGTGRVAIPLAERGVPVTGIELSRPMIDRLRATADDAAIPVIWQPLALVVAVAERLKAT